MTPKQELDGICIVVNAPKGIGYLLATSDRNEIGSVSEDEYLIQGDGGEVVAHLFDRSLFKKNVLLRFRQMKGNDILDFDRIIPLSSSNILLATYMVGFAYMTGFGNI